MFWITKNRINKGMRANSLIHDAIIMGVFDKYFNESDDDYESKLLARSLNWAIPNLNYNFEKDLDSIEEGGAKQKLKDNEDQIFIKGLEIVNSDQLLEKLIVYYVSYEIYLFNILFPKNQEKYEKERPGIIRMKKLLFQSSEDQPNIKSQHFISEYKELFIKFNNQYGKYGKKLSDETVDNLFSLLKK